MSLALLGIGTALPGTTVDQTQAELLASRLCCETDEQRTWLPQMYRQTGIHRRSLAIDRGVIRDIVEGTRDSQSIFLPTDECDAHGPTTGQRLRHVAQHAGPLAIEAAAQALDRAGTRADRVTHLITVSCTGFHAPGVDFELIEHLKLPANVARTNVGFMGCHAALNALRVAAGFAAANREAVILIVATELCSAHYSYSWNPQRMVANALFGDGSAAIVAVGNAPPMCRHVVAHGSTVVPKSADAMSWTVGDHGFSMALSKRVPDLIVAHLRTWLDAWLRHEGYDLNAIASWAVHPGGPKILDAVETSLELLPKALAASRHVFAEHGNMSSPTVLFILDELQRRGEPLPCVALGFGPGLAIEAALIDEGEIATG